MSGNLKLYLLIVILVVLAVVGFVVWQNSQKEVIKPAEEAGGLGSELYQKSGNPAENLPVVNPLENKPEVNPLSETNPFSGVKTNPFK